MRRVLIGLPAAALALLLSACGDPNAPAQNNPTPSSAAPTSAAPTSAAPTTAAPTTAVPPPGTPTAAGRQVVLVGMVEAGVEPGCKVLKTGTGQFLLLGDVPLGVEVRVTGVLAAGVSTTCQQGTPLRVTKVERT